MKLLVNDAETAMIFEVELDPIEDYDLTRTMAQFEIAEAIKDAIAAAFRAREGWAR